MNRALLLSISFFILTQCSSGRKDTLPPASGLSGDMYLVMDSTQWKGPLGEVIDSLFNQEMAGLPRKESIFNILWINPTKLNMVLKQRRNLIFAVSLDQRGRGAGIIKKYFTPESLSSIKSNPANFVLSNSDVFAKGQEVMYLFSNTEEQLIQHIRRHGNQLIDHFNKSEHERITTSLLKSGQIKGISDWLQKNFLCDIKIPFGYKLVMNEKDFIWVRQVNPRDDKNIFISRKKYTSEEEFEKNNLIAYRDEVCKKYLFEDPDVPDSYLITETTIPFIPVATKQTSISNTYAIEMRGLWRANNFSMGGPFVGYAIADAETGYFYYIEGFTFSPGKDQREIMRELESILYTFKTSKDIPKTEP
ncbi:MAG: DUF4837 family protein [Flammeovirgaceae bacterium]|nr:DUF4837 family protein [Flammeovirgaceae bacterium]